MSSKLLLTAAAAAAIVAFAAWAVDVDVSGDLEIPEVVADVDMRGGELPNVDVDTVDIDVQEKRASIPYPDVDVDVQEKQASIPYPDFEVTSPEENKTAEQDDLNDLATDDTQEDAIEDNENDS